MAKVMQRFERAVVEVTLAELSALVVEPARERGFIDFVPTRINIVQDGAIFIITFEKVEVDESG